MSIKTPYPEPKSSPTPQAQVLPRSEFFKRHLAAMEATAKGAPPFKFAIIPRPDGSELLLEDSSGTVFVHATSIRFNFSEAQLWVYDADAALGVAVAWMDHLAQSLWAQIADEKELEPDDRVFLERWTVFRVGPYRMPREEAVRLFGDTPRFDLEGDGPPINWEGPERLVGSDPEFQRRKHAAQVVIDHLLVGLEEQYAGELYAAFMQAWMKRPN